MVERLYGMVKTKMEIDLQLEYILFLVLTSTVKKR
jgi:hypothetical protein